MLDDPKARRFVEAFTAKYHMAPDAHAALAYDATMIVARAIAEAGPDRAKVRDWLGAMGTHGAHNGVTGRTAFGPDGDPVGKEIRMTRVHNGGLAVVVAR
jgi:branched-chain amino acid transport system substrate-binding protein